MVIASTFQELESQLGAAGASGTLERRIPCKNGCDLFIGVHKPSNLRTFRVRFPQDLNPTLSETPEFKDMELRQFSSQEEGSEHFTIQLRLISSIFNDVFTSLVEDVAGHISEVADEHEAASAFISRLTKWQRFLEHHSPEGLTPEEQRGLYGELWFLVHHLYPFLQVAACVKAWIGPNGAAKDFLIDGNAVEVKTSVSKQHQNIQIQSEKQLDDIGLSALFLSHLSLEQTQSTGESLPEMVQKARSFAADSSSETLLEDKLRDYGYLDVHESRYRNSRYILREANLFEVQDGFPRITERDLPPGVGDVRYSVSTAECKHFAASYDDLHKLITEAR